jgi:hypothetical protein
MPPLSALRVVETAGPTGENWVIAGAASGMGGEPAGAEGVRARQCVTHGRRPSSASDFADPSRTDDPVVGCMKLAFSCDFQGRREPLMVQVRIAE